MVTRNSHRDQYRAFFTADEVLADYMVSLLDLVPDDLLFEPAAGEGHLMESAKKAEPSCAIVAYELNSTHCHNLREKFGNDETVDVFERDTILCTELDLRENLGPRFTKVLANPPYGGWQEYERRADLKKRFRGFYVRETYTLFLLRCLRLLEAKGKLVFIVPNTFLYLNMHAPLRKFILEDFCVDSIDILPSTLFPGVSFGYADLCIISITAKRARKDHGFRLRSVHTLNDLRPQSLIEAGSRLINQSDVLADPNLCFPVSCEQGSLTEWMEHETLMSDIAECVTGFYSGNDKEFLRRASLDVKRSNGYEVVDQERIQPNVATISQPLEGISGERCFVPILKGGGFHFMKPPMWYVDWSRDAVIHYKSDRKSRFQNSSYYFRRGIGFPMVTSTKPTAALIENSLFDQSIVGIFPHGVPLEFLLAYCNSKPFWACLKTINPSANNSCRYILRTPVIRPEPQEELAITEKTRELIHLLNTGEKGAKTLEVEILESISRYVKYMESRKELGNTVVRAVAQF